MGMDVYGKNPSTETGKYFRRSIWGWHPLADYCDRVTPEVWGLIEHPHTNNGFGLDKHDAEHLAQELQTSVRNDTAARYVALRDATIQALPWDTCEWCQGTGARTDEIGRSLGLDVSIADGGRGCNACSTYGRPGHLPPNALHYPLEVSDVEDFAQFARHSGGFEIW